MNEQEWLDNNQLSIDIWNKKYRQNNESFEEWLNRITKGNESLKQIILDKKFLFGGRILANRGITDTKASLSNCYVLTVEDSIESIYKTCSDMARTYSYGGGVGLDISNLRPRGAKVNNSAKYTTGAVSFMKVFDNVTSVIGQEGRRAALMLSISSEHPDLEEFIDSKANTDEINNANISVRASNTFMDAVCKKEDYLLRWPTDTSLPKTLDISKMSYNKLIRIRYRQKDIYVKKVKAAELWYKLCKNNWNYAEPGILFWNRITNYNLMSADENFSYAGVNPCQPKWASIISKEKGLTTLENVQVGDEIWSSEGWTKIIKKWSTGIKPVFKYRTSGGVFYGTEHHKLVSQGIKIEAKDCKTIDNLSGDFHPRDFEYNLDAMVDGLVLGDGYYHKASKKWILDIGKKDQDYFTLIPSYIGKSMSKSKSYEYYIKTTLSPEDYKKNTEKVIPSRILKADKSYLCSFLRGLYSANGSIINSKKNLSRITYKTSSSKLRDQLQLILSYLGISSYYTTNSPKKVNFSNSSYLCKESYDINITTDRDKFMNLVGFIQTYKINKFRAGNTKSKNTSQVLSVKLLQEEEVFDITVDNQSHTYWTGGLNVSNCAEEPLPAGGACLLGSLNLSAFVKYRNNLPYFDYEDLSKTTGIATKALNEVQEEGISLHPLSIQKQAAAEFRQIGLGIMGLADTFVYMGIRYGSKESLELSNKIAMTILSTAYGTSCYLGMSYGTSYHLNKPHFSKAAESSFAEMNGLKALGDPCNSALLTIAPTGTLSTMLNISGGIEPLFALEYKRTTKSLNKEETTYTVHPKCVQTWLENHNYSSLDELELLPKELIEASNIPVNERLLMQSVWQTHIDASISSTINLPQSATIEDIDKLYKQAFHYGLKGVTIFREGCARTAILNKKDTPSDRQTPIRPHDLPAKYYTVKVKGVKYVVIVGFLDNKPFEVFSFKLDNEVEDHVGLITKISKGNYRFKSDLITIEDIGNKTETIEEKATTLYCSMLLRYGAKIPFIIKTAKKVSDNITSYTSAVCRILSKFIDLDYPSTEVCPDCGSPIIYENGCKHCTNCGWSLCLFMYGKQFN